MIIVTITKPKFLYDKKRQQFKKFGYGKNRTILTLPVLSIFVSVIIFLVGYIVGSPETHHEKYKENNNEIETTLPVTQVINPTINPITNPINILQNINKGPVDINSIIEAGIKAKIMESLAKIN
jgi:hypothetical protein